MAERNVDVVVVVGREQWSGSGPRNRQTLSWLGGQKKFDEAGKKRKKFSGRIFYIFYQKIRMNHWTNLKVGCIKSQKGYEKINSS